MLWASVCPIASQTPSYRGAWKAFGGCMGEGEGKEPLSGFQTVFRRTWVGGSLEVLQGPALGDQEKGDAKGGGVLLPTLSCLQTPHSLASHFNQRSSVSMFCIFLNKSAVQTAFEIPFSRRGSGTPLPATTVQPAAGELTQPETSPSHVPPSDDV